MGTLPLPTESRLFQELELANYGCGTLIHFQNKNYIQHFAILLENNVV